MSEVKQTKPDDQIVKYDRYTLIVNKILIPVLFFFGIFLFYTTGNSMIKANKNIQYGNVITGETAESSALDGTAVINTNRWLTEIIKIRENKLEKLNLWSNDENTKKLIAYKEFYERQIPVDNEMDYHRIATEIAGVANKSQVEITGISMGSPRLSRNVEFKDDPRYQIYEIPVTFELPKSATDDRRYKVDSYKKLKDFLNRLRNDIKMPFNAAFDVSRGQSIEDGEVKFNRITLMFFYNHKR